MEVIEVTKTNNFYNNALDLLSDKYDKKNRGRKYWIDRYDKCKSERIGYLLRIDLKFVGFLGLIGSEDIIGLSVFYVDKSFRNYSIPFLSIILNKLKKKAIINSSPNPIALKLFDKLYRFNLNNEFIGIPNRFFGFSQSFLNSFYFGKKLNVCYDNNFSIVALIYFTIKYKKICLALR